jgi:hypothetical protein
MITVGTSTTGVSSKINALLAQNLHNNERYLVCCTLLSRMQPSIVVQCLNEHTDLSTYVIKLIRANEDDAADELKRLGIRIMSLYMSGTENPSTVILHTKDWEVVIDIISRRCGDMTEIDFIDVELLQLLMMGLETNVKTTGNETKNDACINLSSLDVLPALIMRRFCNTSISREKSNVEDQRPRNGVTHILKSLLDEQHSGKEDQIALDSFRESMVHFLVTHATLIQTHDTCKSPLNEEFIQNAISLLYENIWDCSIPNISPHVHSLLHYALLCYVVRNISMEGWESDNPGFCLGSEIKAGNEKIVKPMLKLILTGITSSHSTEQSVKETTGEDMVRTLTIRMLANLMETLGIGWMKIDSNKGLLGESGTFCALARLVAGELRIALGRLVDLSMAIKDPDQDVVSIPPQEGDWLLRSEGCIEIALYALRTMLDMAVDDNQIIETEISFNADSILHIRHSLENFLDSCVQFLLEDVTDNSFSHWRSCMFACCRFFGAYLAQVNIFDYDTPNNDGEEESAEEQKSTTSVNLLRALRNGLIMCCKNEDGNDSVSSLKAITLFPCLIATLTCCENRRQIDMMERHLFKDAAPSRTVEKILNMSTERLRSSTHSSLENISWCCLLVDSMLDVSKRTKRSVIVLNKIDIVKALRTTAVRLLEMVVQTDASSNSVEEDIHRTLDQISHSLTAVVYSENNIDWEEEIYEMINKFRE